MCNDVCNKHTIQIYFIPSITKLAVSASLWLMRNCLPYPLTNGRRTGQTHHTRPSNWLACIHLASGLGDDIFVENLFILYENTENCLSILIRFICILGAQIPYDAFSIWLNKYHNNAKNISYDDSHHHLWLSLLESFWVFVKHIFVLICRGLKINRIF